MLRTVKRYKNRYGGYYGRSIDVITKWTPIFLQKITDNYGISGQFNVRDVEEIFVKVRYCSPTAVRLKLWRLYKQGWFDRKREKNENYIYEFSEMSRQYYRDWRGFNDEEGPLVKANQLRVIEKLIEKQIINSDRYLGEI